MNTSLQEQIKQVVNQEAKPIELPGTQQRSGAVRAARAVSQIVEILEGIPKNQRGNTVESALRILATDDPDNQDLYDRANAKTIELAKKERKNWLNIK